MFWVVDLIIVAILLICILLGYKRGLTKSLIKILSFVIALVVALVLFKPISNIVIENTNTDDIIKTTIIEVFEKEEEEEKDENENQEETIVAKPILTYMNEQVEKSTEEVKKNAIEAVAGQIAITVINIGVVIAIFILTRIALIFVKVLTNLLTKLPVIKQCDKLGGIIFGTVQGAIIIFIALAAISIIVPITGNYVLTNLIGESYIGSTLYNYNIILEIIF